MARIIYRSQILKKIQQFEREKKQILTHLAILEKKINALQSLQENKQATLALLEITNKRLATLNATLEVMTVEKHAITDYNSPYFEYLTYQRLFRGKVNQLLIPILKANPEQTFQLVELAQQMLIADNQTITPSLKHIDVVRKVIGKLYKKGVVKRLPHPTNGNIIYWQWKNQD